VTVNREGQRQVQPMQAVQGRSVMNRFVATGIFNALISGPWRTGAAVGLACCLAIGGAIGCGDSPDIGGSEGAASKSFARGSDAPRAGEASAGGGNSSSAATARDPVVHTVAARSGSFWVRWSCEPEPMPVSDPFSLRVELFADEACSIPLAPLEDANEVCVLSVDAAMPHHGHGMNVRPKVRRNADGSYRVTGMLFHMPGRWELMFDVTRGGLLERAQTTVELEFATSPRVGSGG
jgi:hypothetical protein